MEVRHLPPSPFSQSKSLSTGRMGFDPDGCKSWFGAVLASTASTFGIQLAPVWICALCNPRSFQIDTAIYTHITGQLKAQDSNNIEINHVPFLLIAENRQLALEKMEFIVTRCCCPADLCLIFPVSDLKGTPPAKVPPYQGH